MKPLTGKAAVEFKPIENVLLYISASRGAKSGGFTTYNTGSSSSIQPFKPEVLYAYETGFKTSPMPSLQFNGDAYYYDYHDQQVLSATYGANGPVGRFVNAPRSRIWGVEFQGQWEPVVGLTISQTFSYTKGQYTNFFDLDVAASRAAGKAVYIDKSGQNIPFPKVSYGGSVAYVWPVGAYEITAEGNYSYRGKYPSWLGVKYDVASFWLANANLTLAPTKTSWSAGLWVHNLFDEQYDVTRNFFTSADIAQPGAPRTFGVRLGYHF